MSKKKSSAKKQSLQYMISSNMAVSMVIIIIMVASLIVMRFSNEMQFEAETRLRQAHNQTNNSIDMFINDTLSISHYIKTILNNRNENQSAINEELILLKNSNKYLSNMALYSLEGEFLIGTAQANQNENVVKSNLFQKAKNSERSSYFEAPFMDISSEAKSTWVMSMASKCNYYFTGIKKQGILFIYMDYSNIRHLFENLNIGNSGYAYIIDENNNFIFHPQQQLIYSGIKSENLQSLNDNVIGSYYDNWNGRERYVIAQTVNNTRWRLVTVAYMDEMRIRLPLILQFMLYIIIAAIFIFIALSYVIANRITKPIHSLQTHMENVKIDNPDFHQLDNIKYAEIESLSDNYNKLVKRIKNLINQIIEEQDQKRLYELNALQAQINPHFLYNTLDSIIWMGEKGKNKQAVEMTSALAKLFRISISRGKKVINVEEEIEHVRNYLVIQSMRFKDKFTYSINVAPEVKGLKTLKLIVQPIVENAIQHGFEEYAVDEGKIEVSCYLEDNNLVYCVKDNGAGMSEERVKNVLDPKAESGGIGVNNVHQRLQIVFGKEYGISIHSEEDEGTTVYIRLPVIYSEEDVNA
ncbi:MAG: histidine kinase [Christensenellaceae bacterium]|nr:histidine kinase [Christensenellaceae bacterium]